MGNDIRNGAAVSIPELVHLTALVHFSSDFNILSFFSPTELNKNPVEGFSAGLIDDNDIYRWEVLLIGPPDTL